LKPWDDYAVLFSEVEEVDMQLSDIDENIETEYHEFPPCVKQWLSTPLLTDYGKFVLALFLKDQTYLPYSFDSKEVISIMKQSLSKGEFQHYFGNSKGDLNRRHYGHRGVKFFSLWKNSYYMPDCDELQSKGMCNTDCGRRHPIYN
jgi:hypothetical protein